MAAHQAPPSLGFSRQEHWSGVPFPLQCIKVKSEYEAAQLCRLLATPWTAACQALPFMGFSRQEYWSGWPLPSPLYKFSSVQLSHSVVSDSLRPHEPQHARPPCPSPSPGVHSNSRPSSQWCHPAISSFVVPFSSCPQSLPASKSSPMSQLFTWGGQNTGVSALALGTDKNCLILLIQDTYNSQIHRARKYIDRCQGLGVGVGKENGELLFNGTEFPSRNMKYLRDGWW